METAKIIKNKWAAGLALIFLLHLFVNARVLRKDNIYPLYNSFENIEGGYKLANSVLSGRMSDLLRVPSGENPPLISYLLMFNILLFDGNIDMIMHTNMLFLIILIYALYNLGKRTGGSFCGLLSVITCLSFPAVFGTSRIMWNEYPLMCVIALSYCLLFKTEYFRNQKYSLFWSLSIACGLLIRFTLPIYVAIPTFFYIVAAFIARNDYKRLIQRLLLCLFVIMGLCGWWYIFYLKDIMADRMQLLGAGRVDLLININRGYEFLCNWSMYFPLFAVFIVTLPLLLVKCKFEKFTIMAAIASPLLIFIASPDRTGFNSNRYFIPILPLTALSIASAVSLLNKRALRIFIGSILIMVCFAQFILVNIGLGHILKKPIGGAVEAERDEFIIAEQGKLRPYRTKVDPEEFLDLINKRKAQKRTSLLFLGDFANIESFFGIEKVRGNIQMDIISPLPQIMGNPNSQDSLDDPQLVKEAEFVIALSENGRGPEDAEYIYSTILIPRMVSFFEGAKDTYERIAGFKDDKFGVEFALYQKTGRKRDENTPSL